MSKPGIESPGVTVSSGPGDGDRNASEFGSLLRRYRLSAGLSQGALAERAGLSVEAIGMLERGLRRAPYSATLELLVVALNLGTNAREKLAAAVDRRRPSREKRLAGRAPLPRPLSEFIGRAHELTLAQSLFANRTRFLTITGTGGVGKTRFALELAHILSRKFTAGAVFVTLATIRDPAHVVRALLQCLDRIDDGAAASLDALCAQVGNRRVLFVLDNLEQVVSAGPILCELLERCPQSAVLATSREALRVRGEREFALQPLDLDASILLLRDRARAVQPELGADIHHESFAAICRRLDGLPLAIELAAGRLRQESVGALLDRLSYRLDALVDGAEHSPPRQRTLRGAIEWSFRLLNEQERIVFCVASLFAGDGSIEAIDTVISAVDDFEGKVGEIITSLADKHLIDVRYGAGGQPRFAMLETIREYAYEQLTALPHFEEYRRTFAEYFASLVTRESGLRPISDAASLVEVIAADYENVRAVLRWTISHDQSLGLKIAVNLGVFWERQGYYAEPREWLEALADPLEETLSREEPRMGWQVINALALAHYWAGDAPRACELFTKALEIARSWDEHRLIGRALNNLGMALIDAGEHERARLVLEEALVLKEVHDDTWSIASTLGNLGIALSMCRDFEGTLACHERALELFGSLKDTMGEMVELNFIADVYRDRHEHSEAARMYAASLDANTSGVRSAASQSFEGLLLIAGSRGQFRRVAVLAGAVASIWRATGRSASPHERTLLNDAYAAARAALGAAAFDVTWSEGAALPVGDAIEVGRAIARDLSDH